MRVSSATRVIVIGEMECKNINTDQTTTLLAQHMMLVRAGSTTEEIQTKAEGIITNTLKGKFSRYCQRHNLASHIFRITIRSECQYIVFGGEAAQRRTPDNGHNDPSGSSHGISV